MRCSWAGARRRGLLVIVTVLAIAGCSLPAGSGPSSRTSSPPLHRVWGQGCGGDHIYAGPAPQWARQQGLTQLPWLAPSPQAAHMVGLFWPHQPYLVPAGQVHRDGATNKILWLSEAEADLVVTAHPLQAPEPVLRFNLGGGAGGGQWPSAIDLPSTGCWTLILDWSGHVASVNVPVRSP